MRQNCALLVDEEAGEGRVELGERFVKNNNVFKFDVLGDWYRELEAMYLRAEEDLFPGFKARRQRFANWRRRNACESLVGQTIRAAEPLVNGDIMLTLADGRVLVFKAETEDVHLTVAAAGGEAAARSEAASMVSEPGYFTDEPSEAELQAENLAKFEAFSAAVDLAKMGGGH